MGASSEECCKALLDARASPHVDDESGRTAFHCLPQDAINTVRDRERWAALLQPVRASEPSNSPDGVSNDPPGADTCRGPQPPLCTAAVTKKGRQRNEQLEAPVWDPFLGAQESG